MWQTWSCFLVPHTKFRINRTTSRWDVPINDFQYGGRPPFWVCKFWYFVTWPFLERQSASPHEISSKLDDSQLRYGDKPIFKMASVRHLEFLDFFGILVTWPILLPRTKFCINRTINRWNIAKNDFQYVGRPQTWISKIVKFWHFVMRPFLERESASQGGSRACL